ncbi:hypothetical protein [Stigmatella aurantiaca]|uniref:Conserved uncharacterized protein n=1 Tax=Stigmatella aurantiaca (strain DW4/3-1) TaxID=378806 RepID=Q094N8_STIAD|nr:hypothetical protein [Stigmatella aurantiaca]ADO75405.1 conserved uncharacterized protein [Stigmatella aurantiaca DW4/3-1]EAU67194.1 conserved hypothetical protein [Stigmatella aurantiaca DW4/3-1]
MTMDLDGLRKSWEAHDRRLDEALHLNRELLRSKGLDRFRSTMQRMRAMLVIELSIGAVSLVALGSFIGAHLSEPRFWLPGLLLQLAALGIGGEALLQWVKSGSIHYDAPVTVIQHRLERLRVYRIRTTKWVLWAAPLLWTPLLIVALRAGLGVDAYAVLGTGYLLANVLFGLVFLAAMVWGSRRFAGRLGRTPWVQRLARDMAGTNLNAALAQLALISSFEREEGHV